MIHTRFQYKMVLLAVVCLFAWQQAWPQATRLSLEQAVQQGLANNKTVQSAQYNVSAKQSLRKTSGDIGRFSATAMIGQYNSYEKRDNNITLTQSIPFPTVFAARASLNAAYAKSSELALAVTQNEMAFRVRSTWYHLAYLHELNTWYTRTDSLWKAFSQAADLRQRAGETNLLEKVTAESRYLQAQTALRQNQADIEIYKKRLQTLLNSTEELDIDNAKLAPRPRVVTDTAMVMANPQLSLYRQHIEVASKERSLEKNMLAPELTFGYFNQTLIGTPRARRHNGAGHQKRPLPGVHGGP